MAGTRNYIPDAIVEFIRTNPQDNQNLFNTIEKAIANASQEEAAEWNQQLGLARAEYSRTRLEQPEIGPVFVAGGIAGATVTALTEYAIKGAATPAIAGYGGVISGLGFTLYNLFATDKRNSEKPEFQVATQLAKLQEMAWDKEMNYAPNAGTQDNDKSSGLRQRH